MVALGKISIIVPIYNVEKYIRRCIESILNQTYTNFELILIDDGSTDSSGVICDEYANKDNRIKVIHKENGGLSSARNAGLDIATGEYISFVDGDDYIAEDMIEKLYNSITGNNADIAVCNYKCVDENGNCLDNLNKGTPIITTVYSKNDYFRNLACKKYYYYVIACNKLYKKDLFKGIRYPLGKLCEDNHIIDSLVEQCSVISSIKDSLYFYVQRNGSIMSGKNTKRYLDDAEAFLNRTQRAYLSNFECRELLITMSIRNAARLLYLFVRYGGLKEGNQEDEYKKLKVFFDKYALITLKIRNSLKTKILLLLCVINIWNYGICSKCCKLFKNKNRL